MTLATPRADRYDSIVVGGGISGLTAAFYLARAQQRVALIERSADLGGAIKTIRQDGWLFELGPNTLLEKNDAVRALIRHAGLQGDRIVARPLAQKRYIFKAGKLLALPGGPLSFLTTKLFSWPARFRALREPWIPPAAAEAEETIAAFATRRLGRELADYAVEPFVAGVFAGDPDRLALRWALPKIAEWEKQYGSLTRAAFARRKEPSPVSVSISFKEGLDQLSRHLGDHCGDVLRRTACSAIRCTGDRFAVEAGARTLSAKNVVLSVQAPHLSQLLPDISEAEIFGEIPCVAVAVVALGFRRVDVTHPLDGFGFLAPRCEGRDVLGCLFSSQCFDGRAPAGHVALTAIVGGRSNPQIANEDESRIVDLVLGDLKAILGIRGAPVFYNIHRWPRAIPQYELGHGRFVAAADAIEKKQPGLHIVSTGLRGVSLPDRIADASTVAARIIKAEAPKTNSLS